MLLFTRSGRSSIGQGGGTSSAIRVAGGFVFGIAVTMMPDANTPSGTDRVSEYRSCRSDVMPTSVLFVCHTGLISGAELVLIDLVQPWAGRRPSCSRMARCMRRLQPRAEGACRAGARGSRMSGATAQS